MKIQLPKIINSNWFFVSAIMFVIVLPFSQALVSIMGGVLLFVALVEDSWKNKLERVKQNRILLFIPAIFLIYLFRSLISGDFISSFYDLQKTLFFLVVPLAFLFGKQISSKQKRYLFYIFSVAIITSTIVAFFRWKLSANPANFSVHKVSMISHIRFSFQLILVFWFVILIILKNYRILKLNLIILLSLLAVYFLLFLLFQQSLTGLIALTTSSVFFGLLLIFKTRSIQRILLIAGVVLLIGVPVLFVSNVVIQFYNIEKVDVAAIEKTTKQGNRYSHDFENPMVENGHYVFLYVCETELREEWNKLSELKYDSVGPNGFPVHATLLRYLTSKGLRKDAEGIRVLNEKDIRNIENGIANVIFSGHKFSLYPRIYQTVWEYYIYSKTGNANQQSFSQRIEYAKAAFSIIKQNFWFGVGPGNWKEEFEKVYHRNNPQFSEENYASSHNQYLNYMVKFGFVGFVVIMFFLVYPVVKTKKYRDVLFLIFLIFMFFANFADSNLESHMGSSFFVFFYCLFTIGNKTDFLHFDEK